MKRFTAGVAAAAALIGLAGCDMVPLPFGGNQSAATNQANAAAEANQAQATGGKDPASGGAQTADAGVTTSRSLAGLTGAQGAGGKDPAAIQAGAGGATAAMLIGSWADDGDCSQELTFYEDGTFRSFTGGTGEWRLDGDTLTLSGDGGSLALQLQSIDRNEMVAVNPQGQVGRSIRC
jgi:hypothetical protein